MNEISRVFTPHDPGTPAPKGVIPLSVPEIRGNEWKYIKECLDTNWVSSAGSYVDRFESNLAAYVGAHHAVATCSGTAALHLALLVAGVQPDDEVLVSTLTFIAPANTIRYVGAWPVFVDADPVYWQMDVEKLLDFVTKGCRWQKGELINIATGRRVKAILPVHILGHPCDMDPILDIARKYELMVIEDATESLGATYRARAVGHLGDLACFSFNGNKIITTGGGGMVVSDNLELAHRARYLATQAKDDPVEYIHSQIGYNYRLTNLQAAMGCAQLELLDDFVAAKRRIAMAYADALSTAAGITPMPQASWAASTFWMYTVLVAEAEFGSSSRVLLKRLEDSGIQARPLWHPLHLSPAHRQAYRRDCSVSERLAREALSLPSSVGLSPEDQRRVVSSVAAFAGSARW